MRPFIIAAIVCGIIGFIAAVGSGSVGIAALAWGLASLTLFEIDSATGYVVPVRPGP